jgi:Family of unknown function (DUF6294)
MAENTETREMLQNAPNENSAFASKAFTFADAIQRGSCRIEPGAVFTLYSDGSSNWNCEISSGDTNDTWKGTFSFRGADGGSLFTTGSYELEIVDKDVKKRWNYNREANSGYAIWFDAAYAISFNCEC